MMTQEQRNTVNKVFQKFLETDRAEQGWSKLDEQMSMLDWLDDYQLTVEAAVLLHLQSHGQPRCHQKHVITECFVPTIIEATSLILDVFGKTGKLDPSDKFILSYYLALSQVGFIIY